MIVFEGPPGAGKSIQAGLLEERANVVWLSVGKLLRENITKQYRDQQERGELLDDKFVHEILANAIESVDEANKVLIDGYPRRDSQLKWFLEYIDSHHRTLEMVVHLYVPREVSMERLSKRGRKDDTASTISYRYDLYDSETLPLLKELGESYKILEINGVGTIEQIHQRIVDSLDGVINVHKS